MFFLLFFIYGIFAASTEGISKAIISNISRPSETATAIGFYSGFSSVFSLLASSLAGLLWFAFNPHVTFLTSAAGVLTVIIYLSYVFFKSDENITTKG